MDYPQNKIAIVTGGSMGIGKASALKLAEYGYSVVICGRNKQRLDDVLSDFTKQQLDISGITADISNKEDMRNLVKFTVDTYGGIDCLVCNAGTAAFGKIGRASCRERV